MADLRVFAEHVWTVEGPLVRDMGIMFTTRMTIVKLSDGSLWVESPVPTSDETLQRIRDLGPVRYLVAATPRHVWRLDSWRTLFPEAQLWACRPTLMTLQKGRLPLTGFLSDTPPAGWADDFDQLVFKGNPLLSETLFFHRKARTVILGDLIQIRPQAPGQPLRNALFKLAGIAAPYGGVALDMRLTFIHRKLAAESLHTVLSWDFDKLIIAHGPCIEHDAKQFVARALGWMAS